MKKLFLISISIFWLILLSGCSNWNKDTWQGAYFGESTQESDLVYSPILKSFEECKDWAISKENLAREWYTYCSKNCNDSDEWTPVCEEVVTCYDENLWRCWNYEGEDEYENEDDYEEYDYEEWDEIN